MTSHRVVRPGLRSPVRVVNLARLLCAVLAALFMFAPAGAFAQDEGPVLNEGNTAWMLTSTVLVLFMTIPGLALFYGGLVRSKNVLSVLVQCFAITCLVTILWTLYGYSVAFSTDGMVEGTTNLNSFIGTAIAPFGYTSELTSTGIPTAVFFCFQLTFAIITPALIVGAFAERMKFSAVLIFTAVWFTIVYLPVCHMVWSGPGALMWDWGVLDFAGGTVVHINAGIAGLVACILVGKRRGYPERPMPPHNLGMCVTGAAMLWVGWFGFNAGSELAADQVAGMAMLVTQVATATAAFTWMVVEWIKHGRPSALGIATGAVGGLVAITPASGTVGPVGALAIGVAAGVACFFGATTLKRALKYDDALDVFGVHCIGGIVGALLTGIFAAESMGGAKVDLDIVDQFIKQAKGVGFTLLWSGVLSFVILTAIDLAIGLRGDEQQETEGLDIALHEEAGYNL